MFLQVQERERKRRNGESKKEIDKTDCAIALPQSKLKIKRNSEVMRRWMYFIVNLVDMNCLRDFLLINTAFRCFQFIF